MREDKREALLDAAERAIISSGFAGASTRRIAQEAGAPLSLLHYHFGGKEGVLLALVLRARDRTQAAVREALTGDGPVEDRIDAALGAARDLFFGDGRHARLMLELAVAALHNAALCVEVQRMLSETITTLGSMITALHPRREPGDDGSPPTPAVDPRATASASLLIAAGFGLALQRLLGVEREAAAAAFDLLVRPRPDGLAAAPEHSDD